MGAQWEDSRLAVQSTWGSRHAIETPSNGDIPSLVQEYQGIEITCSDCHGSENPANAMGIHGSRVRHILDSEYTSTDGEEESPTTYALCYSCHDRDAVLTSTRFPDHQRHVVDQRISCSSCHDPHGSMGNRALIRFGEGLGRIGLGPSVSTEVLAFESNGPGTGSCYLTCHGYDHNPSVYGAAIEAQTVLPSERPGRSPDRDRADRPGRAGTRGRFKDR